MCTTYPKMFKKVILSQQPGIVRIKFETGMTESDNDLMGENTFYRTFLLTIAFIK